MASPLQTSRIEHVRHEERELDARVEGTDADAVGHVSVAADRLGEILGTNWNW
jgi:hypothetical protein